MPVAQSRRLALRQVRNKMLEEEDDTKVLLTILKHGASIICLHLGRTWVQSSGWLKRNLMKLWW